MPALLGGIVLLAVLLLAARAFVNADPAKVGQLLRWFLVALGGLAAAAIIILLVASERLGPALALVGFLAPVVMRFRKMWWRAQAASGPGQGKASETETEYVRMRLDHDSGAMSGMVKRGPFAGRRLDELSEAELVEVWRQCRIADEAGARLLESYLDRLRPDWRGGAAGAGTGRGGGRTADAMTREEALAVLGLGAGATAAEIKDAHRKLMMKLHPDQGGSTYLAAKINRAKEILIGK